MAALQTFNLFETGSIPSGSTMEKLFTFAEIERRDEVKTIYVHYIDFSGGYSAKYNAPTWEGTFELPCEDDFFCPIFDGGGYVEVEYIDGTTEKLKPICTMCGSTNLVGQPCDFEGGYRYQHKCQDCHNVM